MATPQEIDAAREITANAPNLLQRSQAFKSLAPATQQALLRDLKKINQSLSIAGEKVAPDPYAFALDTPDDFHRHRRFPGQDASPAAGDSSDTGQPTTIPQRSGGPAHQDAPTVAVPTSPAPQTLSS